MQLEFHQLDRRWEHLRVRHPARQRRLLASLADSGQQTPIVVVAAEGLADRYVVIDGYKRIAALFAQHHCDTREAGQLYAAWRQGSRAIRQRLLDEPELFFKAQRQEAKSSTTAAAELLRDLEMVAAIVSRAQRRLAGAAATELDHQQREAARQQIHRMEKQLQRIDEKLLLETETHVEPSATH